MKIRIKFKKYGPMKFIGHLDVMRYFQKVMRRANVDICYSGGFSPHQIMSFASPLGVGVTSRGEYVDIEVNSTESSAAMTERLNAVMTEGFAVESWRLLPDDSKAAMSLVAAADYTAAFRPGYEPKEESIEAWFARAAALFDAPQVLVEKTTKKGTAQMDLKPLVYEIAVRSGRTEGEEQSGPRLFMRVSAGSAANVKPQQVLDAFYASFGEEQPPFALMYQREEVYADLASEKEREEGTHCFQSLEALGREIV